MKRLSSQAWWGDLPLPLPINYLRGIDEIATVVERDGQWCYLAGEWKQGGWWYYYLYGLGVKLPLGTLVLFGMAVGLTIHGWVRGGGRLYGKAREMSGHSASSRAPRGHSGSRAQAQLGWHDDMLLLAPMVIILAWVTCATINHQYHVRYAFSVLPFVFIFASRVAVVFEPEHSQSKSARDEVAKLRKVPRLVSHMKRGRLWLQALVVACLGWNVVSLVRVYPHCLSYFNELAGGPEYGHEHLLSSNIDWGQDLTFLKDWYHEHPEARPFHLSYFGPMDPAILGIDYERVPAAREFAAESPSAEGLGAAGVRTPKVLTPSEGPVETASYVAPGWYALSIRHLKSRTGEYGHFLKLRPAAMAGYSIYIYHVTQKDAERLRREMTRRGGYSRAEMTRSE